MSIIKDVALYPNITRRMLFVDENGMAWTEPILGLAVTHDYETESSGLSWVTEDADDVLCTPVLNNEERYRTVLMRPVCLLEAGESPTDRLEEIECTCRRLWKKSGKTGPVKVVVL